MSLLRTARTTRPCTKWTPRMAFAQQRVAFSDYGSGGGNSAGENPQKQGKNPSEHLEHPGPPPPSTGGQEKGGKQQQTKEPPKNDDSSKAQPRILNESAPGEADQSEDVKKHNREMEQRADKAHEAER